MLSLEAMEKFAGFTRDDSEKEGILNECAACNGGESPVEAILEKRAAFPVARQPPRRAGIVCWLSPGILDECAARSGGESVSLGMEEFERDG